MKDIAGKKTRINGIQFDSELEATHYKYLKDRKDVEIIKMQPEYELFERFQYYNIETGKTSTYSRMIYTPDFLIRIEGSDKPIAIEVKGFRRTDYMLRRKLFIMKYNSEVDFIETHKIGKLHMILERIIRREK